VADFDAGQDDRVKARGRQLEALPLEDREGERCERERLAGDGSEQRAVRAGKGRRFAPFPQQAVRSGFGKVVVVVRNILTKVVSEILINF
jgi:hypothetical protein